MSQRTAVARRARVASDADEATLATNVAAQDDVVASKYLSWVLRHDPQALGLTPTAGGWVFIDRLLEAAAADGKVFTRARICELVAASDKQRFALSPDGMMIRAQQGHSIPVQLEYDASTPPDLLFHGTIAAVLPSVRAQGLLPGQRHHVHLSPSRATATRVGQRRGHPVVLVIRALQMAEAGSIFFETPNGVWLSEHVPPRYIDFDQTR